MQTDSTEGLPVSANRLAFDRTSLPLTQVRCPCVPSLSGLERCTRLGSLQPLPSACRASQRDSLCSQTYLGAAHGAPT